MKLATVGYLPPPHVTGATAFAANLRHFKRYHPSILYSDHPGWGDDVVPLKSSPEHLKASGTWVMNNALFYTGLKMAREQGVDYMLFIESDCRFGRDNWDREVFEEALQGDYEKVVAWGSVIFHSPCNHTVRYQQLWAEYLARHNKTRKNFPIPTYGAGGSAEQRPPNMYVNGALGVYNMRYMIQLFPDPIKAVELAMQTTAWDFEIGKRVFDAYAEGCFEKFKLLGSVLSTYGNAVLTEENRKDLLRNHQYVAVHQIESEWEGPQADSLKADGLPPKPEMAFQPAGKMAICIVSHWRDADWLAYCLRSIDKNTVGFDKVVIAVPEREVEEFRNDPRFWGASFFPFPEDKERGHLWQNLMKCTVDLWCGDPEIDYFFHVDSDCVFAQPATPADYFKDGKPEMLKEAYAGLGDHPRTVWKGITSASLGFPTDYETMCRHPAVYPRWLYAQTRDHVEAVHGMDFAEYVLAQKASFPYGFCEFNTIGGFALKYYPDHFHWTEVFSHDRGNAAVNIDHRGQEPNPLMQFWSHQSLDEKDKTGQVERMGHGSETVRWFYHNVLGLADYRAQGKGIDHHPEVANAPKRKPKARKPEVKG